MNEDRKRVLNLLAEGKIDSNQAERLLDALGQSDSVGDDFATADRPSAVGQAERVHVTVEPETESREGRDHDDSFTVDGPPRLEVENFNGRVEVTGGGPEGSVRVKAEIGSPDRVDYRLGQEGNTVRVEAKRKGKLGIFQFIGMSRGNRITVTVPTNADLSIHTSNGRITIRNIRGAVFLRTSNGQIKLDDVTGKIDSQTCNGHIEVVKVSGDVDLNTSNARITIEESRGTFSAKASNGSIHFDGEFATGSDNRLTTSNGNVKLKLRGEPSLKVEASTTNGAVGCSLPLAVQGLSGKNHLMGVIGSGDASVILKTTNGSISVD
jgi:DUF4097 and DUF4098 domain-containing protein YvlB